jgi:hypothetical protein
MSRPRFLIILSQEPIRMVQLCSECSNSKLEETYNPFPHFASSACNSVLLRLHSLDSWVVKSLRFQSEIPLNWYLDQNISLYDHDSNTKLSTLKSLRLGTFYSTWHFDIYGITVSAFTHIEFALMTPYYIQWNCVPCYISARDLSVETAAP